MFIVFYRNLKKYIYIAIRCARFNSLKINIILHLLTDPSFFAYFFFFRHIRTIIIDKNLFHRQSNYFSKDVKEPTAFYALPHVSSVKLSRGSKRGYRGWNRSTSLLPPPRYLLPLSSHFA